MEFQLGDIMFATNKGTKPYTLQYGGRKYQLDPGVRKPVPVEAILYIFGDHRSAEAPRKITYPDGTLGVVASRQVETHRVRQYFGLHDGVFTDFSDGQGGLHPNIPNIEFTDVDGNILPTIVSDPLGTSEIAPTVDTNDMAAMQRQIESLTRQMNAMLAVNSGPVDPTEIPVDGGMETPDEILDDLLSDEPEVEAKPSRK